MTEVAAGTPTTGVAPLAVLGGRPDDEPADRVHAPWAARSATAAAGVWKWQVEKGPLWPREKGPPMSCAGCRDVAGRSEARGGQVATSAMVVSPPVARGSLVAGGGLEAVAVTGGGQHGGVVHDAVDDGGGGRGIEEDLRPAGKRQIGRHHQAAALVALAHEAEQQVGAGLVERHVAELVENDDVEAGELVELAGQPPLLLRFDELFGLHPSFDRSMILFQDIVQVLDRSMSAAAAQGAIRFHGWNRRAVEAGPNGVDDAESSPFLVETFHGS